MIWFGVFYGILSIVGDLMSNPLFIYIYIYIYIYILNIYDLVWVCFMASQPM